VYGGLVSAVEEDDAIYLDSTGLSVDQVIAHALELIKDKREELVR
jgi:cytidylate kinase